MSESVAEKIAEKPNFDMMGFMEMSQENRLNGAVMDKLMKLWGEWVELLSVYKLTANNITYLVLWLPESVEKYVDETWEKTPSEGFLANVLAQYMCMQAVSELIPQVDATSCAPAPKPTAALTESLGKFGLEYDERIAVLKRRFAVVTHYPFRGGCEICFLQKDCPKGKGDASAGSVLLPGYDHPGQDN